MEEQESILTKGELKLYNDMKDKGLSWQCMQEGTKEDYYHNPNRFINYLSYMGDRVLNKVYQYIII